MPDRKVARLIAIAALILLAGVSIPRLRLDYAPDVSFPEIAVALQLPPAASADTSQTTRRFVIPIESALRSIGDTTGTRGDIDSSSATIVARFKRGTDIDLKAARLASELAQLRASLPPRASIAIWPSRGGVRPNIEFAVTGPAAGDTAQRLAEELRSTPGVRDVRTFGTRRREIDVKLASDASIETSVVVDRLMRRPIGEARVGARRVPLVATPDAANVRDVLVQGPDLMRLGAFAEVRERREQPQSVARLNGRPAAMISVFRDEDASLLRFDTDVTRAVGTRGIAMWSDAGELRKIMRAIAAAAIIATLILGIAGGIPLALYIPASAALAINVWRVGGLRVDAQTLLVTLIAIAAVAPFAASRAISRERWPLFIGAAFILLLPLAATFGSGALAPLLSPPARDFAIAGSCAIVAAFLTPPRRDRRPLSVKSLLRNSASVVLAFLAVGILLLSWFGKRLDPRRTQGSSDRSHVYVRMQLPSGATLEQTMRAAQSVENALRATAGVSRFWTYATASRATVVVEVEREIEQPQRFDMFRTELRGRIPGSFGTVTIQNAFDRGSASSLAESIEEQPYADEDATAYRFLLKGTDADVLRRTLDSLTARLVRGNVERQLIRSEWPNASPRIELIPADCGTPAIAADVAAALARRSIPPAADELPDGSLLRIAPRDAPQNQNDVPSRTELFARPMMIAGKALVVEHAFVQRMSSAEGSVSRELGRFVLPVNITVHAYGRDRRAAKRADIDRAVRLFALPAGVVVERPSLDSWVFSVARARLAAVAAFLPALLFLAAAIALGSLARAAVALVPAALGVALVAPVLTAAGARLDEMTLLATGGVVCVVAALAASSLIRIGNGSAAPTYRAVRRHAWPVLAATAAASALLLIAAVAHPAIGDAWRAPLLASAAVMFVGAPASLILPSTLSLLLRDVSRRRSPAARAIAHPAIWADAATAPQLSVRNLTKVYASGYRALHRVSFDLRPGVVGLLGPNGAGKTTLLRLLTGLLRPTRGLVAFQGVEVRPENMSDFRHSIGFLPQEFNAYAGLTAVQFLDFWALERGMDNARKRREQIEELLTVVGLDEHANRRVREFSGGMRQRIGIARALLGDPPLLVVDEPTTGLDIEARRRFRDLLIALARKRIIILSSHIASDVETTAMHLLLLSRGRLRWEGSVEELLGRADGRVFETIVDPSEIRSLTHQYRITARVRVSSGIRVRGVVAEGQPLPGAEVRPTLEEAYLSEVSTGVLRTGSFAFVFKRTRE